MYGFTQEELAGLIGRGGRERVSGVERAKAQPNAAEILAYSILFGLSPAELFPAYYDLVEENLIEHAYALDERLLEVKTKEARNKRELLRSALARATGKAPNPFRV
jgi:transcriptional regulator with XRE-family HTH domain